MYEIWTSPVFGHLLYNEIQRTCLEIVSRWILLLLVSHPIAGVASVLLVGVVVGCWVGLAIGVSCAGNGSRMPNQAQADMPMPSATIVKAQ